MITDVNMIEYLERKYGEETLEKAVPASSRGHLVPVQKQISRNGKTHTQTVWIDPNADQEEEKKPKLPDTSKKHKTENGTYTAERGRLHEKIKDDIFNACGKPKPGERPQAILMGGGSASGKSSMKDDIIVKKLQEEGVQAGTVDSDEIKKDLPEFAGYKKQDQNAASAAVHTESSEIGAYAIDEIVGDGRHFIYDGTMKNTAKYEALIERLEDAGYDVHVYVVDIPIEEAKRRSDERAKQTGRKVPHSIIESSHRGVPGSVEALKDKVDSYQVFDNTGDGLKLMAANGFVEPELYTAFLEKGGVKYRATD